MLESADISDLLEEVRIRVRIRGSEGALTFRELSEGEQQLLTVLGLIEFTRTSEALFLLDEPDTHLNPAWSMDYSRLLTEQMGDDTRSSQVVVATHDPVAIADLTRTAVVLLESEIRVVRNKHDKALGFERTGRIVAHHPATDPRGMGVSGVLTSELFGLKTTIDPTTMRKIDRRLELTELGDNRSQAETEELEGLMVELSNLGFNYEFVDPYQAAFSERLSRRYQEFQASLTATQRAVLDREADLLFESIMAENGDEDSSSSPAKA
jgi:energy-coupling factor transporter ATP-binding protein EcfA2